MKLTAAELALLREGTPVEGAPALTEAQIDALAEWARVSDGKTVTVEPALAGYVRMQSRMSGKSAHPPFWYGPNGEELRAEPEPSA